MKKTDVLDLLNFWLQPKETILNEFQEHILGLNQTRRIFIDRGSDILFMAHIDTIQTPQLKKEKGNRIWAAGLDDRLGCGIAYKLSEAWDVDLLLCDFEESAASTGQYHDLKDYNWIAEFDRNGGDVVTYDLDNDEFLAALNVYFNVGWGTFSDLCLLNTTACCVNVGLGYKHDHSADSYVNLEVLNNQLAKFKKFYTTYKLRKFIQDPEKIKYNQWWSKDYRNNTYEECGQDIYGNYRECDFCGNIGSQEVYGTRICENCFEIVTNAYLLEEWESKRYGNGDR